MAVGRTHWYWRDNGYLLVTEVEGGHDTKLDVDLIKVVSKYPGNGELRIRLYQWMVLSPAVSEWLTYLLLPFSLYR